MFYFDFTKASTTRFTQLIRSLHSERQTAMGNCSYKNLDKTILSNFPLQLLSKKNCDKKYVSLQDSFKSTKTKKKTTMRNSDECSRLEHLWTTVRLSCEANARQSGYLEHLGCWHRLIKSLIAFTPTPRLPTCRQANARLSGGEVDKI